VEESEQSGFKRGTRRPRFTAVPFPRVESVPVNGIFPVHSQGWNRLAKARCHNMPPLLLEIARDLGGGAASRFPTRTAESLFSTFNYNVAEPGQIERVLFHQSYTPSQEYSAFENEIDEDEEGEVEW